MSQLLPVVPDYKELLKLNNEELISCVNLMVDRAATDALTNCFENLFRDSIMKYLLKIVIKKEIQDLSSSSSLSTNSDDWKRVSLIEKIAALNPNYTKQDDEETKDNNNDDNNNTVTCTGELLLPGYIRNEIKNQDH